MSSHAARIIVVPKESWQRPKKERLMQTINEAFELKVEDLTIHQVYCIRKPLTAQQIRSIASGPLIDPILEEGHIEPVCKDFDWTVEISYQPGLTDNLGRRAQLTIEDFLNISFSNQESVTSIKQYQFKGRLSYFQLKKIAENLLANPLVEKIDIVKNCEVLVEDVPYAISDQGLMELSQERKLALNLSEMQAIRAHFLQPEVINERKSVGLDERLTDVEIEAIAQTWSEHCKHKIFHAKINYKDEGTEQQIDSLFDTYIKSATDKLLKSKDWLVSVFTDNAGIVRFNETHNIVFKVETHNTPSALDPYGGALTGILGVNRDVLAAGAGGARLLANTNVFCLAPLDYDKPLPKRLLHPKRVLEGVRLGVEHGGNKMGVPTVNGSLTFDERFLGKPLIFCGTVGIMPASIQNSPTHQKQIHDGDFIVIAGGRTGKDGIHGATFSSEELNENSPSSAVQIGDPFTQKKLADFLFEARDKGLYRTITDNGAGGFSSSIGELAKITGGCTVHLDKVLLKSDSLLPWEIFLSESQERMTLAVDPRHFEALSELACIHETEIACIGTFNSTKYLHVLFQEVTVCYLDMDFLHNGVPKMELVAEWTKQEEKPFRLPEQVLAIDLHHVLKRPTICSKESIIRQYDHEVQGSTILKPLQGHQEDGPGNASIIVPLECFDDNVGLVISHGICPRYSDIDTYHMAACAIDEAIRNAISVGADPGSMAILDNFCWPDPIFDPEKTVDGKYKLAQLVRANQALYDYALAFEVPIISGKDSMKNDYKIGERHISCPPTLLISLIGKIPDSSLAVTMDVKYPGDWVYVVGITKNELGGSEYAKMKAIDKGVVPKVKPQEAKRIYNCVYDCILEKLIVSCHDCSEGGLAVALAETAFSGGYGMQLDLLAVPSENVETDTELLFSESASRLIITVDKTQAKEFEERMKDVPFGRIGVVTDQPYLKMTGMHGECILEEHIESLKSSWQKTLAVGEYG